MGKDTSAPFKSRLTKMSAAWAMWVDTVLGSLAGIGIIALGSRSVSHITRLGVQRWLLMSALVLLTTCLTAAPLIRFLSSGWSERLDEFTNQIRDGGIKYYLGQFWQRRADANKDYLNDTAVAERMFFDIYTSRYGRRGFAIPIILLLIASFISSTVVIQTGLDACRQHRCLQTEPQRPPATSEESPPTQLKASPSTQGHFAPLGDVTLPLVAAAAVAGGYLFVLGDSILRARRRTLNVSDVQWYILRMILAIPLGMALSEVAAPAVGGLVAFGLGAFPMDAVLKLIRRLTSKSLGSEEEAQQPDQLVELEGVTAPLSATLVADGIESIDELVGVDPVLLSIRTGVPFSSVLRFASQAIVRLHFGERAKLLVPLGLGNAYLIAQLVDELDKAREQKQDLSSIDARLQDVVERLKRPATDKDPAIAVSKATVEACFRNIHDHGYTQFLVHLG